MILVFWLKEKKIYFSGVIWRERKILWNYLDGYYPVDEMFDNSILYFIFVKRFNGYVFAHIVCGSVSKPGGIWGAVFTIYVAIVGSLPQIQEPGYQISPNLCSENVWRNHSTKPKVIRHIFSPLNTLKCPMSKCKHQGFTGKLHRYSTIGSEGMYFLIFSQK